MVLKADELLDALRPVLVGALLAQHWPDARRHEAAGHIGGFLARCGMTPPMIERLIRAVARLAKDEETEDRARFARESAERHESGKKVTGGPSLKALFGDAGPPLVKAISALFNQEQTDVIESMNERFFVVQIGAKMAVGAEPTRPGENVVFQSFEEFTKRFSHKRLGKQTLGKAWLEHPDRRTYERLVFAPPASRQVVGDTDYNIWQGYACEPLPEGQDPTPHIERYLDLLENVIADRCDDTFHYVLDLMADCVQRPGDPPGKALVLQGPQGRGKSLCIETFGSLFGRHFISVNNRMQITGTFNGHMSGRVVVFGDDAVWGGHKEDTGTLKFLVTQRVSPITRKHIDTDFEPNYIHLFLATNEGWAWPAGNNERRGVILKVVATRPREYWDALVAERDQPLFKPALLAYLLRRPVNRTRLLAGIENAALREQQAMSVDSVQQWWQMVLEDGVWRGDTWPEFITKEAIYDQYTIDMGTMRGAGHSHRGSRRQVSLRVREMLPKGAFESRRVVRVNLHEGVRGLAPEWVEKQYPVLVVGTLDACRQAYDRYTGVTHEWPHVADPEQMTLVEE
jgi:hypothetical protein